MSVDINKFSNEEMVSLVSSFGGISSSENATKDPDLLFFRVANKKSNMYGVHFGLSKESGLLISSSLRSMKDKKNLNKDHNNVAFKIVDEGARLIYFSLNFKVFRTVTFEISYSNNVKKNNNDRLFFRMPRNYEALVSFTLPTMENFCKSIEDKHCFNSKLPILSFRSDLKNAREQGVWLWELKK